MGRSQLTTAVGGGWFFGGFHTFFTLLYKLLSRHRVSFVSFIYLHVFLFKTTFYHVLERVLRPIFSLHHTHFFLFLFSSSRHFCVLSLSIIH